MAICPAGAISEDKATGARLVNQSKCIKCRMCIQICPFGGSFYDTRGHKILKCDLCSGDPQCGTGFRGRAGSVLETRRLIAAPAVGGFADA